MIGVLFIFRYKRFCTIARKPGSGRPSKLSDYTLGIVKQQMRLNDKTTAMQLHDILVRHGISISIRTILRSRQQLGLTFHGSAYCRLIREANKVRRLEWAQQYRRDLFDNVIWSDEASIQLETHRKRCYRKQGECPKHPVKVHVWVGISMEGATDICIFTGIMNADFYVHILQQFLLPFLRNKFATTGHRFMQNNDPKHCSRKAKHFFEQN